MATAIPLKAPAFRHRSMAGFIGNVVEWYDFAAGFIMRPLGAAVFGWFGDQFGRARTMQISVALMALPTLLPGLLPSYAAAGLIALTGALRALTGTGRVANPS